MRSMRVLAVAIAVVALPASGQDAGVLAPCHHVRSGFVQDPLVLCAPPRTAWCDHGGALVQCCEGGSRWNGTACVCDRDHHDDQGHCCPAHSRWVGSMRGLCCPDGTEGIRSPEYSTDVGHVGGDVVACCLPGQRLDASGCYEPMPCDDRGGAISVPDGTGGGHVLLHGTATWLDCQSHAMRHASTGTPRAAVTVGPIEGSDDAATVAAIRSAVTRQVPALRACYVQALAANASLAGFASIRITTHGGGRSEAQARPRLGELPGELLACFATHLREGTHLPASVPADVEVDVLIALQHPEPRRPHP